MAILIRMGVSNIMQQVGCVLTAWWKEVWIWCRKDCLRNAAIWKKWSTRSGSLPRAEGNLSWQMAPFFIDQQRDLELASARFIFVFSWVREDAGQIRARSGQIHSTYRFSGWLRALRKVTLSHGKGMCEYCISYSDGGDCVSLSYDLSNRGGEGSRWMCSKYVGRAKLKCSEDLVDRSWNTVRVLCQSFLPSPSKEWDGLITNLK